MSPYQFPATPALLPEPKGYTKLSRDAAKEHLYLAGILSFGDLLADALPKRGRRAA